MSTEAPPAAPPAAPAAGTTTPSSGAANGAPPAAAGSAPGSAAPAAPAAGTPPAPPAAPATGDWREGISKEFKDHPSLKDVKDVDTLVKNYVHAQSMIGADKVVLPKGDDPKLWDPVYDKLGRPKTPDEYKVPEVKLPEGLTIVPEKMKAFMPVFHKAGLNQRQQEIITGAFLEMQGKEYTAGMSQMAEQTAQADAALRQEWGDKYDEQLNVAKMAYKKFATPEATQYLIDSGAGDNPHMLRIWAKIGAGMKEDSAAPGAGGGGFAGASEQAQNELNNMKSNKDDMEALNDRRNPRHKAVLEKWTSLHMKAFPGKQQE